MIYLTCVSWGGRSGHLLKNILTIFILSFFIEDSVCLYHPSWKSQNIINNINIQKFSNVKFDETIKINNILVWNGFSFESFQKLIQRIKNADKNKNVLISIGSPACRVHPFQLHNWYNTKLIENNYYMTHFKPLIKKFYYGAKTPKLLNRISIHVRRGDIANQMISEGFSANYYKRLINVLNKYHNIPIFIYSENYNSDDLHELRKIRNVKVLLGGVNELKSDFNSMVTSKILFLSSSSFATWAAYISIGDVYYHHGKIKHFNHIEDPTGIHRYKGIKNLNNIIKNSIRKQQSRPPTVDLQDIVSLSPTINPNLLVTNNS